MSPGASQAASCPVCASPRVVAAFQATDRALKTTERPFRLSRCKSCECVFQDPPPAPSEIGAFYPDTYSSFDLPVHELSSKARALLSGRPQFRDIAGLRRAGVDSRIAMLVVAGPQDRRFGRVLDVGAGSGHFLAALGQVFTVDSMAGVDPSTVAVDRCRERGIAAVVGTVDDVAERDFNLVILNHVLEHVLDPAKLIQSVAQQLRVGGYLLLSLPDLDSGYRHLLGDRWGGYDVPRHIVNFSRAGVRHLLKRDFEVVHRFSDRFFMSNFAQFFEHGFLHRVFWHRASLAVWRAMERVTNALDIGDQQVWLCRRRG